MIPFWGCSLVFNTQYHKLKLQECAVSQFCWLEVQNQGVSRTLFSLKALRDDSFLAYLPEAGVAAYSWCPSLVDASLLHSYMSVFPCVSPCLYSTSYKDTSLLRLD